MAPLELSWLRPALLLGCALWVCGCHGPKGAPDSTVKSFYAAAGSEDWGGMVDCLAQNSLSRLGSRARAMAYFESQFKGWKKFDITIDDWSVGADDKTATVRFDCTAEILDRYKVINVDCGDTFGLVREEDGKWHINLPTAQRMRTL